MPALRCATSSSSSTCLLLAGIHTIAMRHAYCMRGCNNAKITLTHFFFPSSPTHIYTGFRMSYINYHYRIYEYMNNYFSAAFTECKDCLFFVMSCVCVLPTQGTLFAARPKKFESELHLLWDGKPRIYSLKVEWLICLVMSVIVRICYENEGTSKVPSRTIRTSHSKETQKSKVLLSIRVIDGLFSISEHKIMPYDST